MKVFLAVVYKN